MHYGVCENGECRRFKALSDDLPAARQDFFLFFTSCARLFDCFDVFRLKQNQSFGERLSQLERFNQ